MRFEDLNWMDVESYLVQDDRVMLVLGACEQHGYLSLATDMLIPQALADAASERTGVLVAPPVPYGVSPMYAAYPGTVSLRLQTFLAVVEDAIRSLHDQGFRGLLVLNGHGGNIAAGRLLQELVNTLPGMRSGWYSWWEAASLRDVAQRHGLPTEHASWMEAFAFTQVAPLPTGTKELVAFKGIADPTETRRRLGDGVGGGPYQVSKEIMDEAFEATLRDVVRELESLKAPPS